MIPTEVVILTTRYQLQDQENNDRILGQDFDNIDELKDLPRFRIASYQHRITKAYNNNIKVRIFLVGELVLMKIFQNTKDPSVGKLTPK